MVFKDRAHAGIQLAKKLQPLVSSQSVIYALPRGGVVTASQIASELILPFSLIIVRKIGHPQNPEYAICAVSENQRICDPDEMININSDWLEKRIKEERQEIKRRQAIYLNNQEPIPADDQTAIIIDDGVATGLTIQAAIAEIRQQKPQQLILAVPVIPKEVADQIRPQVDHLIALEEDKNFEGSVGAYFHQFNQVTDQEVVNLLTASRRSGYSK